MIRYITSLARGIAPLWKSPAGVFVSFKVISCGYKRQNNLKIQFELSLAFDFTLDFASFVRKRPLGCVLKAYKRADPTTPSFPRFLRADTIISTLRF